MPPKKVLCQFPPGLLEQADFVAQVEHRTRSDLIRESLRRYIDDFKRGKATYSTSDSSLSETVKMNALSNEILEVSTNHPNVFRLGGQ